VKLTKCENKHFYDADKYDECPHCAKKRMISHESASSTDSTQQKTLSFAQVSAPPVRSDSSEKKQKLEPAISDSTSASSARPSAPETLETVSQKLFSPASGVAESPDKIVTPNVSGNNTEDLPQEKQSATVAISQSEHVDETKALSEFAQKVALTGTSVHTDRTSNSGDKTIAFYDLGGVDPVVGWLICVIGEYVGECFNLKAGQNFIGRSLSMDVALKDEKSISREFHAGIIFDPSTKQFYVIPGQSNGLTYVNGNLIFSATPLKSYDKIQLGKSTYIFMAFAGTDFMWDTYIG